VSPLGDHGFESHPLRHFLLLTKPHLEEDGTAVLYSGKELAMNLGLATKTVIVTGSGSNIGRAIALVFAGEGCNVIIADIDEVQGKKVAQEANRLGAKAIAVKTDVTDFDSATAMVNKTLNEFGKVDILVNNVGYSILMPFRKMSRELIEKIIDLNFRSVLNCTQATVNHMIQNGSGRIINIGSDISLPGGALVSIYAGCKGGIISFSKSMARELGRYKVNVNVICPAATLSENDEHYGPTSMWQEIDLEAKSAMVARDTIAIPLGRIGKPEDIAKAAVFLASDAASFITGQTLCVDGGWQMY
jgi:2-hydroxycyclohexanecarboxyl-CoA dehydrogenase